MMNSVESTPRGSALPEAGGAPDRGQSQHERHEQPSEYLLSDWPRPATEGPNDHRSQELEENINGQFPFKLYTRVKNAFVAEMEVTPNLEDRGFFNRNSFRAVMQQLDAGKSLHDFFTELDKEGPDIETIQGLQAVAEFIHRAATRDESGENDRNWEALSDEEKQWERLAQITGYIALMAEYRSWQEIYDKNDIDQSRAQDIVERIQQFAGAADIPQAYQEKMGEFLESVPGGSSAARDMADTHAPKPEQAPEKASAAEAVAAKAEKVFGESVIAGRDIKALQQEITGLVKDGTPESAYKAVQQLAHLKQAGISMSKKSETTRKVQAKLASQLEHFRSQPPLDHARYLGYLKMTGMLPELTDEDRRQLSLAAIEMSGENRTNDLLDLMRWNKYLGVHQEIGAGLQQRLQENARRRVRDRERGAVGTLAAMKYLEIPAGVPEADVTRVLNEGEAQATEYAVQRKTQRFVNLRNILDFVRGSRPVAPKFRQQILGQLNSAREQARTKGRWGRFTALFSGAARLSRERPSRRYSAETEDVAAVMDAIDRHNTAVAASEAAQSERPPRRAAA